MLYYTWLTLLFVGGGLTCVGLGSYLSNWKEVRMRHAAIFAVGGLFLLLVAGSASQLDQFGASGVLTDQNDWYIGFIFYLFGLIDIFMIIPSIVIPLREFTRVKRQGY